MSKKLKKRFNITPEVITANENFNAETTNARHERSVLFRCRNAIGFLTNQKTEHGATDIDITGLSCKRWNCPDCARLKAKIFQKKLHETIESGYSTMITLTFYRSQSRKEAWASISPKFHKFCRYIRENYKKDFGWIYSIEAHKDKYPHIHCVINCEIPDKIFRSALKYAGFGHVRHQMKKIDGRVAVYMSKYLAMDLHKTGNVKYVKGQGCRIVQCCRKLGAIFNFTSDSEFDEVFTCADNFRNPKFEKQAKRIYEKYNNLVYHETETRGRLTLLNTPLSYSLDLFDNLQNIEYGTGKVNGIYKSALKFLLDKFQRKQEVERIYFGDNFVNGLYQFHNKENLINGFQKPKPQPLATAEMSF